MKRGQIIWVLTIFMATVGVGCLALVFNSIVLMKAISDRQQRLDLVAIAGASCLNARCDATTQAQQTAYQNGFSDLKVTVEGKVIFVFSNVEVRVLPGYDVEVGLQSDAKNEITDPTLPFDASKVHLIN